MPTRNRVLIGYVASSFALVAFFLVAPDRWRGFTFIGLAALVLVAIAVGLRMHRPARRRPWLLLAAIMALAIVGDLAWAWVAVAGFQPQRPWLGDAVYLAIIGLFALVLIDFLRARHPVRRWVAVADAIVIGAAALLVLWPLALEAVAENATLPLAEKLVTLAYPTGDALILGAFGYLWLMDGGRRSGAFVWLGVAMVSLVLADMLSAVLMVVPGARPMWAEIPWLVGYVSLGVVPLLRSMRGLTDEVAEPAGSEGLARIGTLALAVGMLPLVAVVQEIRGDDHDLYFIVPISLLMIGAVTTRIYQLGVIHRRTEARHSALLTHASDAFTVTQTDGTILFRSAGSARVTGYPDSVRVNANILDIVHPDHQAAVSSALARAVADPTVTPLVDYQARFADGRWHWVSAVFSNHLANPIIGGIVGNYRDVTEQRLAQDKAMLQARLLDEVRHAVVASDARGRITYWNHAAEQMYGWHAGEAMGRSAAALLGAPAAAIVRALTRGGGFSQELELRRRDGRRITAMVNASALKDDNGRTIGAIGVGIDITDRKRLETQLREQAFTDGLTGLANRALFLDRLSNAISRARREPQVRVAVMFLDIDDFKMVNDSLGHEVGDALLGTIASRITAAVRPGDTVSRLGGDEFAVLLDGADSGQAKAIARRVLDAISAPTELAGRELLVTASLGIAGATRTGTESPEELLRNADLAMYEAKRRSHGAFATYRPQMHRAALRRLQLRTDLERAIEQQGLSLVFQPIIRLADNRPMAAEALLRWEDAPVGRVSTTETIATAEESGLIVPLGRWVVREALAAASRWQAALPSGGTKPLIHINAAVTELLEPDYADFLHTATADAGIKPSSVVIEITETAIMAEATLALPVLEKLRGIGVLLAIDDFGTGYSSLNYLARFPVDMLKLDRSLVSRSDSGGSKITRSVIDLARSLRLDIVAEGIERPEELQALLALGCAYGQGYLLGRPMSSDDMLSLLKGDRSTIAADDGKDPMAVQLGRLGGRRGGPARAAVLSPEKRSAIARRAAQARWGRAD